MSSRREMESRPTRRILTTHEVDPYDQNEEVDLYDPRGKRPVGEKKKGKKKKKTTLDVGMLMIVTGMRIPIPLIAEEERMQLKENSSEEYVGKEGAAYPLS